MKAGEIETEPSLTDRFLGGIDVAFEGDSRLEGVTLRSRTMRPSGPHAPEAEFGADLAIILHVAVEGCRLSKGLLVQAKWAGRSEFTIDTEGATRPRISARI